MRASLLSCILPLLCIGTFVRPATAAGSDDLSLFLRLTGHTLTAPTRWNGHDWLVAGSVVAGTGAASVLDDDTYALMERNHTRFNDGLHEVGLRYGSGITGVAAIGGLYLSGLAFENPWLRETGVLLASALSTSVLTETALKFVVGRARPYAGLGHATFKPFNGKAAFVSFPSGHTVVAFTLSAVLAERIHNTWASIGLYSLATLAGASRLYSRDHWLSDVVFSGALSTCVAHSVVRWYERGMNDEEATGLHIIPRINGVAAVWRF